MEQASYFYMMAFDAIAREKEVKGWRREKKNKLVESMNPTWKDLAADWYPETLVFQGKPVKAPS